jgi:isochorismate hydrolase
MAHIGVLRVADNIDSIECKNFRGAPESRFIKHGFDRLCICGMVADIGVECPGHVDPFLVVLQPDMHGDRDLVDRSFGQHRFGLTGEPDETGKALSFAEESTDGFIRT